eukprot:scaffold28363_cov51-Attheya_sp.AAC.1
MRLPVQYVHHYQIFCLVGSRAQAVVVRLRLSIARGCAECARLCGFPDKAVVSDRQMMIDHSFSQILPGT